MLVFMLVLLGCGIDISELQQRTIPFPDATCNCDVQLNDEFYELISNKTLLVCKHVDNKHADGTCRWVPK